jgi:hypothetical protein
MSSRSTFSCLFSLFFLASLASSQVIIRERVELKRQPSPLMLQSASGDSSFLVRAEWDVLYDDPNYVQFLVTSECDIDAPVVEQGPQYRVRSVPYVANGVYSIGFWHYGWPDTLHVTVRVFKANEPERTYSLAIGPYRGLGTPPGAGFELGDFWGTPFTTRFFRWFAMSVWKQEIFPSDGNFFELTGKADTCTGIQWYPTADSVTLMITEGSELGRFVSQEGAPLGATVTRLASEIPFTKFVADTGSTGGGLVTVQASSKGVLASKTFRVLPFLGKTLRLEGEPPIIAFGRNSGFRVEVLDAVGEPIPIPQGITFKYEIVEGAQWGVLFDYDTWQTGTVVEGASSVIDLLTADTAQYEDKRMVVRVSSSDAGLTPDTTDVLILPGLLKVTVTPTTLQYGESAEIVAEGVYRDGELVALDPSVTYSYEIVQAPDAGYLVVGTDTTRRDVIPDVGPTARFIAEEEAPQPGPVQVIVKVTARQEVFWGKVDTSGTKPVSPPIAVPVLKNRMARTQQYVEDIGVARVVVTGSPIDHFLVTVVPDTIVHGETAIVHVQPQNNANEDIELDGETLLNVLLDAAGQTYGKLTGAGESGPLVEITYEQVKEGKLQYVADGDDLTGLPAQQVKISVVLSDDETKEGVGTLTVKPLIEQFCQGDSSWAGTKYDNYLKKDKDGNIIKDKDGNPVYYGIGEKGCALTCMAMVAKAGGVNTDPGKLAVYMNEHNGFQGTSVKWATINSALGINSLKVGPDSYAGKGLQYEDDGVTVDLESSESIDLSKMDTDLSNGGLIIAQVYNPNTRNQHWVLVTGKQGNTYTILDPGCYKGRTDLTVYSSKVYKIAIYHRS